ncbi:MAG: cupredoxin domain-containing protein [Betaproteobacteria bacterium]|nr:MAG: cupredoxin domain-containing protein [Betaproteobacteria bacterium]
MRYRFLMNLIVASGLLAGAGTLSAQEPEFRLVIRDHKFEPTEMTLPAGKKVKLIIENKDATAEEFESYELNREKVVPAKGQVALFIGPLKPGRYPFFGDFHKDTAKGVLIVQ